MTIQLRVGGLVKVRVCTGTFEMRIVRVIPPVKHFNGEVTYECSTDITRVRPQRLPHLTTVTSARSIVGSTEFNDHDCTVDCSFYTDHCTGVK